MSCAPRDRVLVGRVHAMRNLLAAPDYAPSWTSSAPTPRVSPNASSKMETDPLALHGLPRRALVQGPAEQPDRTPEPGTETTQRRRRDVPDKAYVIWLVVALLVEINDRMIAAECRYSQAEAPSPPRDTETRRLSGTCAVGQAMPSS